MSLMIVEHSEGPVGVEANFQARIVSKVGTGTDISSTPPGPEGKAIVQADVSTIACAVYDLSSSTPTVVVATPTISIAGSISNSLTVDSIWSHEHEAIDATGRNFLHTVAGSVFAIANHVYRVCYTIVLTNGSTIRFGWDHTPRDVIPT